MTGGKKEKDLVILLALVLAIGISACTQSASSFPERAAQTDAGSSGSAANSPDKPAYTEKYTILYATPDAKQFVRRISDNADENKIEEYSTGA